MEVCFKGSLKNLYNIFAAAGSLPKRAIRVKYTTTAPTNNDAYSWTKKI